MAIKVEDKIAIHELLSRLYVALDSHNPESFASFFTSDGVFSAMYGEYKGHSEIAGFIDDHIKKGNEDHARHLISNFVIEEVDGTPMVRSYITKIRLQPAVTLVAYADLKANVVRQGGNWLIRRFDLSITLSPN
ncbi:MAG TPA: nuclear transport factor 2 family protein [Candidatus Binataceae bacterium]|nr:nuclear transport factor 2 family protein [Candidatus Binataceae bacterium]